MTSYFRRVFTTASRSSSYPLKQIYFCSIVNNSTTAVHDAEYDRSGTYHVRRCVRFSSRTTPFTPHHA